MPIASLQKCTMHWSSRLRSRASRAVAIEGALRKEIRDPSVRAIVDRWMIGSIDLFNDNHMLDDSHPDRSRRQLDVHREVLPYARQLIYST